MLEISKHYVPTVSLLSTSVGSGKTFDGDDDDDDDDDDGLRRPGD